MTSSAERPRDGAWRRIERLLPTQDELPQEPQHADTDLHWMPGPPVETPQWIVDSWKKAADERREHPERGEVRIPGVPRRRIIQNPSERESTRKLVSFREVVGDEKADAMAREEKEAQERMRARRRENPAYQRLIRMMTYRLK